MTSRHVISTAAAAAAALCVTLLGCSGQTASPSSALTAAPTRVPTSAPTAVASPSAICTAAQVLARVDQMLAGQDFAKTADTLTVYVFVDRSTAVTV